MASWEPTKGAELIPCPIENKDFDFALEQVAEIVYIWLQQFEFRSPKKRSATAPNLHNNKEIR